MGANASKALSAGELFMRAGQRRTALAVSSRTARPEPLSFRPTSSAEFHNAQVLQTPRAPIGMLWNVEGNGQHDTMHITSNTSAVSGPLPLHKYCTTGEFQQVALEGYGLGDMMHPPDNRWLETFPNNQVFLAQPNR